MGQAEKKLGQKNKKMRAAGKRAEAEREESGRRGREEAAR